MDIIYRYDIFQPISRRRCSTAEEAIKELEEGNRRQYLMVEKVRNEVFGSGEAGPIVISASPFSLGFSLVSGQAPVQSPYAIVLGCSDARAPIELIFDHSHNELFVIRVAGNVLGIECLGSIEYAAKSFPDSVRVIAILGHTGCGAVGAAVEVYLKPEVYGKVANTHALRSIVDRILVVVRIADKALERRCGPDLASDPGYKAALWQMAVYLNAALTAHDLSVGLDLSNTKELQVVYGVYDLASQRVEAAPGHTDAFARAPKSSDEFNQLADHLVDSILSCGLIARYEI